LAQLYLRSLIDKLEPNEIRSAIETFRKEGQISDQDHRDQVLARAYGEVMERINGQVLGMRRLATKVLLWITHAKRQLTTSELQHALATRTGKFELDDGDLTPIEDMVSVCAGLVTVDEESGTIRLVHYTAQQYLERLRHSWFPHARTEITTNPNPFCTCSVTNKERGQTVKPMDANAMIATSCLTYLLFSAFDVDFCDLDAYLQGGKSSEQTYPLLNYCMEYGALYARLASPEPPGVAQFFSSESNIANNWFLFATGNGGPEAETTAEWLLERGAFIDTKDSKWKTPLHHAAFNGWRRCVQLLLQRGASLDPDSDNMTPFHYTVGTSERETAQIFLDFGTPVDLTVRRRIITGMIQNDRVTYRVQDDKQNPVPNGSSETGLTSLHLATLTGSREMTKYVLEHGANPNYASDYGETPLHLTLKQNLSGPQCLTNRDFWSDPETRIECILDYVEDEEYLSTRGWVNKVRSDIANLLLEQPGIDVNAQDISGASPLHIVSGVRRTSKFMIQSLIEKGARVSIRNNEGQTPLHLACQDGNVDAVDVLLASGADPTECDENGANTLHYAARRQHKETIRNIIDHVPESTRGDFAKSTDKHSQNALHYLWKDFSWTKVDSLKFLLETSADVNELDQASMSPIATFLSASVLGQSDDDQEVLRLLFGHGANASFRTQQGMNLAHLAARSGRASPNLLRILASQKVDVRARDDQGRTALHHGVISGELTEEVLCCFRDEFNLSTELLDAQGKTPLAYAVEKGQDYHDPYMFEPDRWARIETLLRE
jgi:ankyrin repeat protein